MEEAAYVIGCCLCIVLIPLVLLAGLLLGAIIGFLMSSGLIG